MVFFKLEIKQNVKFENILEVIDKNFMQNVQDFFAKSMNIALQCFDNSGEVTNPSNANGFCKCLRNSTEGCKRCKESLQKSVNTTMQTNGPIIFKCHAGLTNIGLPILINGQTIAMLMGGQVLTEEFGDEYFRRIALEMGIDGHEFVQQSRTIRIIPPEKLEVLAEALFHVINSIASIAYANFILAKSGIDYKIPKNIGIQEWFFLNRENADRPLTDREVEILRLIVSGKSNPEIAKELFISVHTVKAHVSTIMEKFCVADRTQVAVKAVKKGLI